MTVRHGKKIRFPADLEPSTAERITAISEKESIPRSVLLRIFIKYSLANLEEALAHGDRIKL